MGSPHHLLVLGQRRSLDASCSCSSPGSSSSCSGNTTPNGRRQVASGAMAVVLVWLVVAVGVMRLEVGKW